MTHRRRNFFVAALLGLVLAALAASVAQAHPFIDHSTTSVAPQIRALKLRSEGMNAAYSTTQAIRALTLRSEALNKANGLGTSQGVAALRLRSEALNQQYGAGTSVSASSDGFNWTEGAYGAAGVFASVLILASAIFLTRRRSTALGV